MATPAELLRDPSCPRGFGPMEVCFCTPQHHNPVFLLSSGSYRCGAHLQPIPGHDSWKCTQPQLEGSPERTEAAEAVGREPLPTDPPSRWVMVLSQLLRNTRFLFLGWTSAASAEPEIGSDTAAEGPEMFRRRQEPSLVQEPHLRSCTGTRRTITKTPTRTPTPPHTNPVNPERLIPILLPRKSGEVLGGWRKRCFPSLWSF